MRRGIFNNKRNSLDDNDISNHPITSPILQAPTLPDAVRRLDALSVLLRSKEGKLEALRRELAAARKAVSGMNGLPQAAGATQLAALVAAAEAAGSALAGTTGAGDAATRLTAAYAQLESKELELDAMRSQLHDMGGRSAARREAELVDALELVTQKHQELVKSARAREEQARALSKELALTRSQAENTADELRLAQRQLDDPAALEAKLQAALKQQAGGRPAGYGERRRGAEGKSDEDDGADASPSAAKAAAAPAVTWLWRLAAVAWAVTAVALAAACLALVASLLRSERLSHELQTARGEAALARHLRLMDAVRDVSDAREAAGEAAGQLAPQVCAMLCPEVEHAQQQPFGHAHHGGFGHHVGHVPPPQQDTSTRRTRVAAAVLAVTLVGGPWLVLRYCDSIPFLRGGSPHLPSKRFGYTLDTWFSTNPNSKPLALLLVTAMLVTVGTSALFATSGGTIYDEAWTALAGVGLDWTFAGAEGRSALERVVALFVSLGGMMVTALMLGIVSDTIGERMDQLRKGRSEVLESGHTLILGWSDKLLPIVKQLAISRATSGGCTVVVLAERDKEEMDAEVRHFFDSEAATDTLQVQVICRRGSCILAKDLHKVSVRTARSVIVLSDSEDANASDAKALRVVLALTSIRQREGMQGHVVVEVNDLNNEPLLQLVGGPSVETVVSFDVIGRLMLLCARQPGLAFVFEDLMGFEGAEFHCRAWPQLVGRRFGEVMRSFPEAVPCGVKVAANRGKMLLNPTDDYVLQAGDELCCIAEDDDSYRPEPPTVAVHHEALPATTYAQRSEKVLFCGWRRDMGVLLQHLDQLVPRGSEVWLFSNVHVDDREERFEATGFSPAALRQVRLTHEVGDPLCRADLECLPLEEFDSVLILSSCEGGESTVQSDSRSLATLLLMRDIQTTRFIAARPELAQAAARRRAEEGRAVGSAPGGSWIGEMRKHAANKCEIISEILDTRTTGVVAESRICDYVLSNELISKTIAMVCEDQSLNSVLAELFRSDGNELYIRPAADYAYTDEELCFFECIGRARQNNEVLIGWRCGDMPRAVINPPDKVARRTFALGDVFILMGKKVQDEKQKKKQLALPAAPK